MEERRIENIRYFNIGVILNSIALILMFLTNVYEDEMLEFGSAWGGWWYSFVDSAYLIFLALGIAAMAKATNYKHKIWPNSKEED
jgi:hypothetical protein